MKYAEIKDMAGLDSARQKLTADIEAKGNEVISRWENVKEDYSPAGLLAYGLHRISGKVRYDRIALLAVRAIKRMI